MHACMKLTIRFGGYPETPVDACSRLTHLWIVDSRSAGSGGEPKFQNPPGLGVAAERAAFPRGRRVSGEALKPPRAGLQPARTASSLSSSLSDVSSTWSVSCSPPPSVSYPPRGLSAASAAVNPPCGCCRPLAAAGGGPPGRDGRLGVSLFSGRVFLFFSLVRARVRAGVCECVRQGLSLLHGRLSSRRRARVKQEDGE